MIFLSTRFHLSYQLLDRSVYISWFLRIFLGVVAFFTAYYVIRATRKPQLPKEYQHLRSLRSLPVQSECTLPKLDPWDPIVMPYYSKPNPLVCSPVQKQAINFKNGIVHFNKSLLEDSECYITPFWHNEGVSDFDIVYGNRTLVNFKKSGYSLNVKDEFFEVRCTANGVFTTQDVFAKNYAQVISVKKTLPLPNHPSKLIKESTIDRPSVIMIGLDSMSRQNFLRQLPETHKRMQKIGFLNMLGHIKIHDNTYGNLVAVLMGKRGAWASEFPTEIEDAWDVNFDDYNFVWENFTKNGYATFFAEDRPDIATFNYMRQLCGFTRRPVNHYLRPFWLATFWSILSRRSRSYCYDEKPFHRVHLDHLEDFIQKYQGKRKFAFWWTQDMSHDYLNLIGRMDNDLDGFLERNEKNFEKSFVIVFSDHGNRYDRIRETVNGRLESRLPFFSIRLPQGIKEKHPLLEKQLVENSKRMTTPFDIHETLNDIAWGTFTKPKKPLNNKKMPRGYSLFGPTPKNRTCSEAGVPEDYCPCFKEKEIPIEEAKKAAQVLLARINDILTNAPDVEKSEHKNVQDFVCSPLELDKITYASIRLPSEKVLVDPKVDNEMVRAGIQVQYRIVLQAKQPSGAILEGIVVRDFTANRWYTTNEFERNNAYGETSSCVMDSVLKKLCFCIKGEKKQ